MGERKVDVIWLADGRQVPAAAVEALDRLDERWPGATFPGARPAIVAEVIAALEGLPTTR